MRQAWFKRWLAAAVLFLAAVAALDAQQLNLGTQAKGVLKPANGGLGIVATGLTGCPAFIGGVVTINEANCGSSTAEQISASLQQAEGCLLAGSVYSPSTNSCVANIAPVPCPQFSISNYPATGTSSTQNCAPGVTVDGSGNVTTQGSLTADTINGGLYDAINSSYSFTVDEAGDVTANGDILAGGNVNGSSGSFGQGGTGAPSLFIVPTTGAQDVVFTTPIVHGAYTVLGHIDPSANLFFPSITLTGGMTNGDCVKVINTAGLLGDSGAPCGGGGSSGTPLTLGQFNAAGTAIGGSPVTVTADATFTATVAGSTLSAISVTSGTLYTGQVVYSSTQINPIYLLSYNAGAGTGTLSASPGATGTVTFTAIAAMASPLSSQVKDVNGVYQGSQNAPNIGRGGTATITAYSVGSGSITLTVTSGLSVCPGAISSGCPSATVTLLGFPTSTFLNGQVVTLTAGSSTSLTGTLAYGGTASVTEGGLASNLGVSTLYPSVKCVAGCTLDIDPLDTEGVTSKGFQPNTHVEYRRNGQQQDYYFNTDSGPAQTYIGNVINADNGATNNGLSGNTGIGVGFLSAVGQFNQPGWDYGAVQGEFGHSFAGWKLTDYAAGITNLFNISGYYSKQGDFNGFPNWNAYFNIHTASPSSEGFVGARYYINALGAYSGTVLPASSGSTLRMAVAFNPLSMSSLTPMIDVSEGVQTGTVTYTGTTTIPTIFAPYTGTVSTAKVEVASTTGMTYTASAQGYIPAQANIQGIIFAVTTSGPSVTGAVTMQFVNGTAVADGSAVTVTTNAIVVNINAASTASCITGATLPCTRSLSNIVSLFASGSYSTTAGGVETAFLQAGSSGNTASVVALTTGQSLVGVDRQTSGVPVVTTFAVVAAAAPTTTSLLSIVDGALPEVTQPSIVGTPINSTYPVTAALQFFHYPSTTCQGGAVGDFVSLNNYTTVSEQVAFDVFCSPTSSTLWMGTLTTQGTNIFGQSGPASLYQGANTILVVNPTNQTVYTQQPSDGTYAYVAPYASTAFAQVGTATACSVTSNVATLTGTFSGGVVGNQYGITGFSGSCGFLNLSFRTLTAFSSTSLSFAYTHADLATTSGTGTVADEVINLPGVNQTYTGEKTLISGTDPFSTILGGSDIYGGFLGGATWRTIGLTNDPCLYTVYNCGTYPTTTTNSTTAMLFSGPWQNIMSNSNTVGPASIPMSIWSFIGRYPTGVSSINLENISPTDGTYNFYNRRFCNDQEQPTEFAYDGTTLTLFGSFPTNGSCNYLAGNHLYTSLYPTNTWLNGRYSQMQTVSTTVVTATGGSAHAAVSPTTQDQVASNVLTLTGTFPLTYVVGQTYHVEGCPTNTGLNGLAITLTSASATTLVAPYTHANLGPTAEACVVSVLESGNTNAPYTNQAPTDSNGGTGQFSDAYINGSGVCSTTNLRCVANSGFTAGYIFYSNSSGQLVPNTAITANAAGVLSPLAGGSNTYWNANIFTTKRGSTGTITGSATTQSPGTGFFHWAGTGSVATITPISGQCGTTGTVCEMQIVSDAGYSTVTGGNIACAVTTTIGQEISWRYDTTNTLWYPSTGCSVLATPTVGTGVTSATCLTSTCTNLRGTYSIVGGTATTGTILSLAWTAQSSTAACQVMQNGGAAFYGIGHSVATTTGMNITAGVTVAGATVVVDYECQP